VTTSFTTAKLTAVDRLRRPDQRTTVGSNPEGGPDAPPSAPASVPCSCRRLRLALVVALGGTSYAADALPKNSVGTLQLKNQAVTSLKVKDGALGLVDFAAAQRAQLQGAQGAQGAQGPKGDKGEKGDKGATGAQGAPGLSGYTIVESTQSTKAAFMGLSVNCPAGRRALGGGGGTATPGAGASVRNSFPLPSGTGWLVVVEAKTPGNGWSYKVQAVCATVA